MFDVAAQSFSVSALHQRTVHLDQIAVWHHRECVRQGLQTTLEQRKSRLLNHLKGGQHIPQTWLAESDPDDGKLAGCISLVSYHLKPQLGGRVNREPEPLWLSNLYVAPQYRRMGLGETLVGYVIDFASDLGHKELWLMAGDQTEYYLARGWHTVRRARIAQQPVNIMRLAL